MQRKLLGLLFAAAAYGLYKYSRMTPEEKSDIKKRGKDFLNKNVGNAFGNKPATVPVNKTNYY
jgi:hypothetical protein